MPHRSRWALGGLAARLVAVVVMGSVSAILAMPASSAALQEIPASRFEPAINCGCHSAFYETWSESMHAQALSDPIYRAKVAEANAATGGEIGPFCETCHGPVAAMGGLLGKKGKGAKPRQATEGIGCAFCHQVVGTTKPAANSSFVLRADGIQRARLKDAASPSHESKYSRFHETAEFCGMCHDVNHPANGMALEATYTEWKNGPYAKKGIVCQDCHMTPGPGVTKPNAGRAAPFGVERDHAYTMTFVGGNTALGPKGLAEERLRGAAELRLSAEDIVAPGSPVRLRVSVKNVGAGHYLPTGVTDLRRVWLEVVVSDASGRELLRERRTFGTELANAEGEFPVEPWEAVRVAKDDRIAPGATVAEEYETEMPSSGPVTVVAGLYYQGAPVDLADRAGVTVPITEMAKSEAAIYATAEQKSEAAVRAGEAEPNAWLLPSMMVLGIIGVIAVLGLAASAARRRGEA